MFQVQVVSVRDAKARVRAKAHRNLSARRALNHLIGGGRSIQMIQKNGHAYEVTLTTLVGKDTITVTFMMNVHRACPCHPRGNAKGIQSKCQPGCPASELAWTLQRPDQRGESETRTAHAWPVQSVQQRVREERGVPAVRRKSFFTLHCRHS